MLGGGKAQSVRIVSTYESSIQQLMNIEHYVLKWSNARVEQCPGSNGFSLIDFTNLLVPASKATEK
jgi:hypothetical protein